MLGFGVITVISSLGQYSNMVQALSEIYQQFVLVDPSLPFTRYPYADFARVIGLTMMTVDAGVLGFTIWWAITRMNKNQRAFWVPVIGWLTSTIVSTILLSVALSHDPAFWPAMVDWANRVAESGLPTPAATP